MVSVATQEPFDRAEPDTRQGADSQREAPAPAPRAPLRLRLPPDPAAAATARRALADLEEAVGPRVLEDLRLLVSELVTNSVRHAGASAGHPVEVEVSLWPQRVRVEVGDAGQGSPARRPPTRRDPHSGWALSS